MTPGPGRAADAGSRHWRCCPHALIGAYGGDTRPRPRRSPLRSGDEPVDLPQQPTTGRGMRGRCAGDVQVVVPVDYDNDAVRTALVVARALEGRLWGVQLATSENLVDVSIIPAMGTFPPTGRQSQARLECAQRARCRRVWRLKILGVERHDAGAHPAFRGRGRAGRRVRHRRALLAGRTGFTAAWSSSIGRFASAWAASCAPTRAWSA